MKKSPFKFLDAYGKNDTDIFFGRNDEIDALYEMVFQNNILLVYGASGTGKTSLIQCGLAGRFKSYDWLPLTVRRGSNINDSLKKVLEDAGGNLEHLDDDANYSDIEQLTGFAKLIRNVNLNHFKPIYLIFDQFEELYIINSNKDEELQFIKAVSDILLSNQPVKLIFSIREEYLGYLNDFEKAVPQLLKKKLRVEPITRKNVIAILKGVNKYEESNIKIEEKDIEPIADGIIVKLLGRKQNQNIQLPYFQVFMDKLESEIRKNDKSAKEVTLVTMEGLGKIGDIDDVLRDFLESQVKIISQKVSAPGKPVSAEIIWKILLPFSTLKGTKEPLLMEELLGKDELINFDETLVKNCIGEFVTSRILNKSENTNRFELAHDSLAKCIAEKRSDDEIALLEIRRLIDNQLAVQEDAREPFTEKQLNIIEPYLKKLSLTREEDKLIKDSKKEISKRKNRIKAVRVIVFSLVLIVGVYVTFLWLKAKESARQALISLNVANNSDITRLEREKSIATSDSSSFSFYKAGADIVDLNIKKIENLQMRLDTLNRRRDSLEKILKLKN